MTRILSIVCGFTGVMSALGWGVALYAGIDAAARPYFTAMVMACIAAAGWWQVYRLSRR